MTRANVICVVYAIDNPTSSNRIAQFWIPFIKSTGVNVSVYSTSGYLFYICAVWLTGEGCDLRRSALIYISSCCKPSNLNRERLSLRLAKIPLVLVGNKMDLRDESSPYPTMEQTIVPIMEQFRVSIHWLCSVPVTLSTSLTFRYSKEIETCMECSAFAADNVSEVFYLAQKAVLHPTAPLYDSNIHELKPACQAALLRIFKLCDKDKDGLLNNSELNEFQKKCFNMPLQHAELDGVKGVVLQGEPMGIVNDSMTEDGEILRHLRHGYLELGCLKTN